MIVGSEAKPAVALWRAVIAQAMQDAVMFCGVNKVKQLEVSQARSWLLTSNANFNEVCALADLEPTQVRVFARKAIADADARVAERAAIHERQAERMRRGHEVRKAKRAGVVADFSEKPTHRSFPTAEEIF